MPDVLCLLCIPSDALHVCVYVCGLSDLPQGGKDLVVMQERILTCKWFGITPPVVRFGNLTLDTFSWL